VRLRVYLWKLKRSIAADIVQDVKAQTVENAIAAVMLTYDIERAAYVWVVGLEDESLDVHRYNVVREDLMCQIALPPVPAQGGRDGS